MASNLKDTLEEIEQGHLPPLNNPQGTYTTRDGLGVRRFSADGIETTRNDI